MNDGQMTKLMNAIAIGAHKMLQGTGYSFVFAVWETDKPIRDETIGISMHPLTPRDQAADACALIQKKLKSKIIH